MKYKCENIRRVNKKLKNTVSFFIISVEAVKSYLEKTEDESLMGFGQNGEALLISEEDAGGKYGRFDRLPEPLIDHRL